MINTQQNQAALETVNPLSVTPFFAIPRIVGMLKTVSDAEFRLLSILYSAFGDDGHIEFKLQTLSKMMNKATSSVRRIIDSCERKELIETRQTGRSLRFNLINDKIKCNRRVRRAPKNEQTECSKMSTLLSSRKQKEKTNNNNAKTSIKSYNKNQAAAAPKINFVVVSELKNMLRDNLKPYFNLKTYLALKTPGLTDGQIKSLVIEANENKKIKSLGWLIAKTNAIDDIKTIPDFDEHERKRQKAEDQKKMSAISEQRLWKKWENNAISSDEAKEINLKRKGLWEETIKREKEQLKRDAITIGRKFEELKAEFFATIKDDCVFEIFEKKSDDSLRADQAFNNFCWRNYWKCL